MNTDERNRYYLQGLHGFNSTYRPGPEGKFWKGMLAACGVTVMLWALIALLWILF